ncbi:MAG: cobaltochelatase subunit CobN, partial [Dehalococcoidia bacterium]|nr:cobaltochelatase subunit CobN [Dehalococcoidia bacterium]
MVDTLHALTRLPNLDAPSLPASIAAIFDLDWAELLAHQGKRLRAPEPDDPTATPPDHREAVAQHLVITPTTRDARRTRRRIASATRQEAVERLATLQNLVVTAGDAVQIIDELAKHLLRVIADRGFARSAIDEALTATFGDPTVSADVRRVLTFVCDHLAPTLQQTGDEIANLLRALDGGFVPAGPSGAPTRGMAHVLPTGRNFYAVDPRALPSMAAWEVGQGLAREVLARYQRETGAYPESVAISIWGTSTMRTYGDDAAEVLALLGVRPVWQRENHRVVGVELIPLAELGRPRIDVTVRVSGFFRDAFPHLIALLNEAVDLVINADEPLDQNFVRAHYLADLANGVADDQTAR